MPKTKTKCQKACCQIKKCQPMEWVDKFQDYLVRGTYIIGSCLIIYSLLMFNGLMAENPKTSGDNFVTVTANGIAYAARDIWYETVFFVDDFSYKMGDPLNEAINLCQRGLAKTFTSTGNLLSQVPEALNTPPHVWAKGH